MATRLAFFLTRRFFLPWTVPPLGKADPGPALGGDGSSIRGILPYVLIWLLMIYSFVVYYGNNEEREEWLHR